MFDFGLMLSFWGRQPSVLKYESKSLDLNADTQLTNVDLSKFFICWGVPTGKNACWEK